MEMLMSPGLAWWLVRREADRFGAHHVRLVPTGGRVEILLDAGHAKDLPPIADMVMPVLAMRLKRLGSRSGWHLDVHQAGFAPAIHLIRRRSDTRLSHPSDWSEAYQMFRDQPEGLLVLIRPDAYLVRHGLTRIPQVDQAEAWRSRDGSTPELYDADQEEGRELALHAALAGRAAVAISSKDDGWWQSLGDCVKVRVLRAQRTPHGLAWDVA
jgi:hypothetical protein